MPRSVIAVGIDGSEGSRRALRWALDEAGLRGCTVEAVTAWPPRGTPSEVSDDAAGLLQRKADELQRHVVSGVLSEYDDPPAVSSEVVHGDAIDVLLRMSAHAELLVVGSHGITGMRHAALGSVSEACARLAECPSVVVPAASPPARHSDVATVPDEYPSDG